MNTQEAVAAINERSQVAGKGGRIAGDIGNARDRRSGDFGALCGSARAGGVQHQPIEPGEL